MRGSFGMFCIIESFRFPVFSAGNGWCVLHFKQKHDPPNSFESDQSMYSSWPFRYRVSLGIDAILCTRAAWLWLMENHSRDLLQTPIISTLGTVIIIKSEKILQLTHTAIETNMKRWPNVRLAFQPLTLKFVKKTLQSKSFFTLKSS